MEQKKNYFDDYVFSTLRMLNIINEVLFIKNGANFLSASHFAWVIGGGLHQQCYVESPVNNPSPLIHQNTMRRCSHV